MMDRLHPADSRTAAFLHRLRAMHPRDCLRIFCIQHIDHLVFSMDMSDVPEPPPAWGELTIECKMIGADDLGYCAFLERELVCRVCARRHVLLLAQFGFGNPFVLGDGYTSQPHRGRGIFTKVLRYALNDLKTPRREWGSDGAGCAGEHPVDSCFSPGRFPHGCAFEGNSMRSVPDAPLTDRFRCRR